MLSDFQIKAQKAKGRIVIEPFRAEALNPNSYDLTLGPYLARYVRRPPRPLLLPDPGHGPYVIDMEHATGKDLFRIEDHTADGVFRIDAGESILCHTNEFIGGRVLPDDDVAINTQMRATSTAGRHGLTACRCAGHGDAGYFDRWTLEVQNNGPFSMDLHVGMVICQLVFFQIETPERTYQQASGNYQTHDDLERLILEWKPENMLPKKLKKVDPSFWRSLYAAQKETP